MDEAEKLRFCFLKENQMKGNNILELHNFKRSHVHKFSDNLLLTLKGTYEKQSHLSWWVYLYIDSY